MTCVWPTLTKGTPCLNGCGYALKRDYEKPPIRNCRASNAATVTANHSGFGDQIESALTSVGITKERWLSFKDMMGLPRTCNCDARKNYLNKLGEQLGSAAQSAVEALMPQPVKIDFLGQKQGQEPEQS